MSGFGVGGGGVSCVGMGLLVCCEWSLVGLLVRSLGFD